MKNLKISQIEEHNYLGNKTLYDLCEKYPTHTNSEHIAAKAWLIGRSYAVSPQRRKTQNKNNNKKYNFFFENFAQIFAKNKKTCNEIDELIEKINKSNFSGNYDNDKDLIITILKLIFKFNQTVVDTIKTIDKLANTKDIDNKISFTSKYLHFHCPNCIYIYDTYSLSNARKYIKPFKKEFKIDKLIKEILEELKNTNTNTKPFEDYAKHFVKSYFIATRQFDQIATPRQLDNALLTEYVK